MAVILHASLYGWQSRRQIFGILLFLSTSTNTGIITGRERERSLFGDPFSLPGVCTTVQFGASDPS